MKYKKISLLLFLPLIISCVFVLSGCIKKKNPINYKLSLEVWGVFDDSDAFDRINNEYARANNQIGQIRYRKISSNLAEYERELFDAIASGKGPDVFFFNNSWLTQHENKIVPMPSSQNFISEFKNTFVETASDDFIKDNQIFAMPLDCDTLTLYYNKNILNQSAITSPPQRWNELEDIVPALTKIDSFGNINQSAIALGRSKDPGGVNRSSDILSLLMLQKNVPMTDEKGRIDIARNQSALDALNFYTQFSQGSNRNYTWNNRMDYSVDSFRYGKTAMMINYSYWANQFRKTDPRLNFDIAPVPQFDLENKINFANYWGLAVTSNKILFSTDPNEKINYTNQDRTNEAWKYIYFMTTGKNNLIGEDPTVAYLEKTKKIPARLDLIEKIKNDPLQGVFAVQALTAKSWKQPEVNAVETIFNDTIDDVASGKATSFDALQTANSRINNLQKR